MAENGRLPDSALAPTQIGGRLRKDAAASVNRMALEFYLDMGTRLLATDTYRSYAQQVQVKADKGDFAATPGTSNHGWGIAVDFASQINIDTSPAHRWMERNAGAYGWENPYWARNFTNADGRYEPWHWEYDPSKDRKKGAAYIRLPERGQVGLGHSGAKVREIQQLLNKNLQPANDIKVDGDFGFGTAVAVIKFQGSRGLSRVGVVGPQTLARLKGVVPTSRPTKQVIYLRAGTQKRDQVKALQRFLNRIQDADLIVDGDYGPKTVAAVKRFQRRHDMTPTGTIGRKTLAAMKRLGLEI